MERDRNNLSTYSVPGAMSDVTLMGTPLPQAASTATKSRSVLMDDADNFSKSGRETRSLIEDDWRQSLLNENDKTGMQKSSLSANVSKHMTDLEEKWNQELAKTKDYGERLDSGKYAVDTGPPQLTSWPTHLDLKNRSEETARSNQCEADNTKLDFEFRMPSLPSKSSKTNATSTNKNLKTDPLKNTQKHGSKVYSSELTTPNMTLKSELCQNVPVKDNASNFSKISTCDFPKYEEARGQQNQEGRFSIASSANSSLGIISSEVLEEAQDQPLHDFNMDLSHRLAQQLNLDTSLLNKNLDISTLAAARLKEKVAARCNENKENETSSNRSSSDYHITIHGYSSDGSDSKNNTAKEIARLSSLSCGDEKGTLEDRKYSPSKVNPLRERNSSSSTTSFLRKSTSSGRSSVGSNPFGDYSKVSVSSEDFRPAEEVMEQLRNDGDQFGLTSWRSLSGIYGDGDFSFSTKGEKLSMTSFLRSGSGPLGSLEKSNTETQRPQFGMQATSPEKKSKLRGILPPPNDKSTFVVDEVPVRDTQGPWQPHSLVEQFSLIHNNSNCDVSVPSLSYISNMLDKMQEGVSPREMLDQLMASSSSKNTSMNKPQKKTNISSVVEGERSFCQGYELNRSNFSTYSFTSAERPQALPSTSHLTEPCGSQDTVTLDDSNTASVCNVTDFDGDEGACICVMTPESMDFDVFNDMSHPQQYNLSKACYVSGRRQDSAAFIRLPVNKFVLHPGQRRTVSITIAALIEGEIKIKIEVTRTNLITKESEVNNVYGKIVAEFPMISLMTPQRAEMKPVMDPEFQGTYSHMIQLKNNGRSVVPVKLVLTQLNSDENIYHFGDKKNTSTLMLESGQTVGHVVYCETPPVFAVSKSDRALVNRTGGTILVEAQVDFLLATTDVSRLSLVSPLTLVGPLKPNFFCAPSSLLVPTEGTVPLKLFNSCDKPVPFRTVTEGGFSVQPTTFVLQPRQTLSLSVKMDITKYSDRSGDLTLHSFNPPGMFTVKLQGTGSSSCNSSLVTPQSSRATSPTSPCSRLGTPVPEGELHVVCTDKELVWGACALQERIVKVCCLKNHSNYREKLRLRIVDKHQCFKIVTNEEGPQNETKLSLQPMENREIRVAVLATTPGPKWGHLTISRIGSSAHKRVMHLFAFGGRCKMDIKGVLEIPQQHLYIHLDEDTLSGSFVITNTGDAFAFFAISEDKTVTTGLSLSPPEQILPAGHSMSVQLGLSVTPQRLELTVCYGEESTRQRLLRLCRVDTTLSARFAKLALLPAQALPGLDKLNDPVSCAEMLWQKDIGMWTIGVVVKRSALEARRLDTSINFVDLAAPEINQSSFIHDLL